MDQPRIVPLLGPLSCFWILTLLSCADSRNEISQDNATPLLLIRDAYEAIILTAFFYLLLTYLSPDPEVQKAIFRKRGLSKEADAECRWRGQPRRKWVFPLGFVRWKPQVRRIFVTLFYTHAKQNELTGWPVFFATYEVVCTSVLRHPAYVRHITHYSFFLSLTLLMAGPHSPL
jgi:hypothetical protein